MNLLPADWLMDFFLTNICMHYTYPGQVVVRCLFACRVGDALILHGGKESIFEISISQ